MREIKYAEILAANRELGSALQGKPYRIALLSNIVVNQLGDLLEFCLRSIGIPALVVHGDFDNIVQDSVRLNDCDAAIVFWETCNLVDGLHLKVGALESTEIDAIRRKTEGEIALVLTNLSKVPLLLCNRFSSLVFGADNLRKTRYDELAEDLNRILDAQKAVLIALDSVIAKTGLEAATDFRQFQSSKALYSLAFLKNYVLHVERVFAAANGKTKKVLVLDCDNTLWGGILGEDGDKGIALNEDSRTGKVFQQVQQLLKGFRRDGVLLAICSKNNPDDVRRIFDEHPDMVLRNDDFAAVRINWDDKASNLRALAKELNLGLDSFIFVDDSDFELGLIRDTLPEVVTLQVPRELSAYPQMMIKARSLFFGLGSTAEDARKTEMYREEAERRLSATAFSSVDGYLRSLELVLTIFRDDRSTVARIAQLTQKTNQFNLTTRRYTEADIENFLKNGQHAIFSFSVSDRYGDYGVTGLAIIARENVVSARIDVLLMSCRVIGRNIERAFLNHVLAEMRVEAVERIEAEYLRTSKNDQVSSLFDMAGFELLHADDERRRYALQIDQYQPQIIDYIRTKNG